MNEKMRRKDRETTEERAYEILKNGFEFFTFTLNDNGGIFFIQKKYTVIFLAHS